MTTPLITALSVSPILCPVTINKFEELEEVFKHLHQLLVDYITSKTVKTQLDNLEKCFPMLVKQKINSETLCHC